MGAFVGERISASLADDIPELPNDAGQKSFELFGRYLRQTGEDNLERIREDSRAMMTEKVGVFRSEEGLTEALATLQDLKERADNTALKCKSLRMNPELIQRWELDNLLAVSYVTAYCALNRRESRGGHARSDFPERENEYNHHTLASMTEFGSVEPGKRQVDMSIFEAGGEHNEHFGVIERKY
jgi:succinate dehydrogenase / fumarate reductase flavoprotein subunit